MALEPSSGYEPSYPHSLSARSPSRASAGQASQASIPHALHIPPSEYQPSAPPTPSSKSITGSRGDGWTDLPAMPCSASAHELETEPQRTTPKNPPFIPQDFLNNRRPWENEAHKYTTAAEAEAKFREMEAAIAAAKGQNPSNSFKARKFGRSVVNLLRQKSNHALADNASRYEPPVK